MKWFIFVVVLAAILVIFGLVYAITGAVNKRKRPKYKTTAPDDESKIPARPCRQIEIRRP